MKLYRTNAQNKEAFGQVIFRVSHYSFDKYGEKIATGEVVGVLKQGYLTKYSIGHKVSYYLSSLTEYCNPNDLLKEIL